MQINDYDYEFKRECEYLKSKIRTIPDFPKKGIMFRDITTLLNDSDAFRRTINVFASRYNDKKIDVVAGIESRGFIFGGALAYKINARFVPVRKPGKLPYKTISQEYDLEYGKDKIEIHEDAIKKGDKVLIIDDLIATGGTAAAACDLIEKIGGKIYECGFVVELPELKGWEKIKRSYFKIIEFEGE
jgi:adenine phosphoribosyltransferase